MPKKSVGIALPVCLISIGTAMALGIYCWRLLSFNLDIIDARNIFYDNFYAAERLLTAAQQEVAVSFRQIQDVINKTKKPYVHNLTSSEAGMRADVIVLGKEQTQDALQIHLSLIKNREKVITLSCVLIQKPLLSEKGTYDFHVDFFTISSSF